MVYFLRNYNRKNYFEVEVWNGKDGFDLSSHVYSYNYSKYLLELQKLNEERILNDWLECLEFIEEFRGWFWEQYVPQNNSNKNLDEVAARKAIKDKVIEVANILNLHVVVD